MTLLIDKLRRAQHMHPEDKLRMGEHWIAHQTSVYRKIRDADARYDFTESALAMASDLKISTPEGLFQTLQSVLREPKTIWIEAQDALRRKHLNTLRNTLIRPLAEDESLPNRVGLLLHIGEPGLATVRVIWDGPNEKVGKQRAQTIAQGQYRTQLQFDALTQRCSLVVNPLLSVLDVRSTPKFLTKEEFKASAQDPSHPDYEAHSAIWNGAGYKFGRDITDEERIKIAYWTYAVNLTNQGFGREQVDEDYIDFLSRGSETRRKAIISETIDNAASEVANLVAMLAVLESERSPDILHVETRKGRPTQKKAKKAKDAGLDPIRTLTMNVSSDIRKAYENSPQGGSEHGSADHGGRVRHFVRGHYFWARNGLLTYRTPHWRGSIDPSERLTVTKVT